MIPVSEFVTAVKAKLDERGESDVFRSMAVDAKEGRMSFDDRSVTWWHHRDKPETG